MIGRLASVKNLKANIGRFTAVMALNEVSCLEFISSMQSSSEMVKQVYRKCQEHNLLVTELRLDDFNKRRKQYYIAQLHEAVDGFCVEFRKEIEAICPEYKWTILTNSERRKQGDETPIEELLRVTECTNLKNSVYYSAVEYYRRVRNAVVHGNGDCDDLRKLQRRSRNLKNRIEKQYITDTNKPYYFSAPNEIQGINFDDVRLFGWAASRLAIAISTQININPQALVKGVFTGPGGRAFRGSYRKLRGAPSQPENTQRLKKALLLRLVDRFGLTREESTQILSSATLPLA